MSLSRSAERLFAEVALQTRLKYLAFKRLTWMAEVLILLVCLLVLFALDLLRTYTATAVLCVQCARVVTEIINHYHLSGEFNVRDRWVLYPFI